MRALALVFAVLAGSVVFSLSRSRERAGVRVTGDRGSFPSPPPLSPEGRGEIKGSLRDGDGLVVALALVVVLLSAATAAAARSDPGDRAHAADPARGRAIVVDRHLGMCLMCHSGPFPEVASQGDLASDLRGAGARWTSAQLRARIVDARRLDPRTIMPAYGRSAGLWRVAPQFRGQPILTPQQIDDVVAFLATLRG